MSITTLLAISARKAGTTNGPVMSIRNGTRALAFLLDVSACSTDAGDMLDVKIQHSPDGYTTWDDFVHFNQVFGDGGPVKEMAFLNLEAIPDEGLRYPSISLPSGSVIQGPIFPYVRAVGAIIDADGDGEFTYSVTMQAIR